jgi:hypothetical protein
MGRRLQISAVMKPSQNSHCGISSPRVRRSSSRLSSSSSSSGPRAGLWAGDSAFIGALYDARGAAGCKAAGCGVRTAASVAAHPCTDDPDRRHLPARLRRLPARPVRTANPQRGQLPAGAGAGLAQEGGAAPRLGALPRAGAAGLADPAAGAAPRAQPGWHRRHCHRGTAPAQPGRPGTACARGAGPAARRPAAAPPGSPWRGHTVV